MSTIIDSLIVTLGLDAKDVDSKAPGVRNKLSELEKGADKSSKSTSDLGKSLKATEVALGAFLAVLGGTVAVKTFIKDAVETNTQLYFLSRNLEMSTQKLFAWGAAAQEIGGNRGTIQNFIRTIAEMPGQLLTGKMPQLLPLFARLGINFREPFSQIMVDLAKRFSGMDRKIAFSFGLSSGIPEDVMNLILEGPGAIQAAMGRTSKFGATAKEAASAAELKRGFTDLELQLVKIGYDLLQMVAPAMEKFIGFLEAIAAWAQRHERIVVLIAGLATALTGVAVLGPMLKAVSTAWTALMGAIAAAGPTFEVLGIVAAIGAAILLLWQDYKVWSEGGRSYFDWSAWTNMVSAAGNAWHELGSAIENALNWLVKWYDKAMQKLGFDTSEKAQTTAEQQAIEAYNRAHPEHRIAAYSAGTRKLGQEIARREGFYNTRSGYVPNATGSGSHFSTTARANIPQRAHNPGDLEYGTFALAHGATGYILAQGGKKIAIFPDDQTGFMAMYSLLGTKGYAGLSADQAIARWQNGPGALLNGVSGASRVPSSVSTATSTSSTSNDNSRVTNIGTINLQNPLGDSPATPTLLRGMDLTTLLAQQNFGSQ